jgi:uncharacterized membrane protein YccC
LRLWARIAARDPHGYALRRAVRAAVAVPAIFAIGSEVIGNPQVATFAAFGSFALLLFVNFTGPLPTRALAYLALAVVGVVLITLGTLLATPDWLAVAAMAVIGFVVIFFGAVSSLAAAGTQAALLSFILAVLIPGPRTALPDRLAGWGLAVAIAVPVALFVWPPEDQDELRLRVARLCRRLASMLALEPPEPGEQDRLVGVYQAASELRSTFSRAAVRTAAVSTGTRMLIRLVEEIEWLTTTVVNACADAPERWPEQGLRLRASAAAVLRSCGDTLDYDTGPDPLACGDLDICLAQLEAARRAIQREVLLELQGGAGAWAGGRGELGRPLYAAHELGYVVALAGRTVAMIAAADSRSWWAKAAGRRVTADELGTVQVVRRSVSSQLDRRSVWLQNSVRGAAGLALAVLLARLFDAQNAFWIGLGALSVLRSNALSTGASVLRALLGTAVGFIIGGAIVAGLGTSHAVLWPLLPVLILLAGVAPAVISFAAGQAAFTVVVIVLFNIIAPAGWRIGVVRIEDVALGCAASLVATALFWPRGAGTAFGLALRDAYRSAAVYLEQAVDNLTGVRVAPPDAGLPAMAAGQRLDDALRQYLAERGEKQVPLTTVARLANGAARVRLAGTAIKHLHTNAADDHTVHDDLQPPGQLLVARTHQVAVWYDALGHSLADRRAPVPTAESTRPPGSFLEVVLPAVDYRPDPESATHAEQLLWSGQYLGDVDQLRPYLVEPAQQVATARNRPWWRR